LILYCDFILAFDIFESERAILFEWTLCDLTEIDKFLDDKGSLTFDLKMIFRFHVQEKDPGPPKGHDINMSTDITKQFRTEALSGLASLLNDEATSDVTISIVDCETEVGKFFCHKKILSGKVLIIQDTKLVLKENVTISSHGLLWYSKKSSFSRHV